IRLGWVAAPPPVLEKINLGKQAADLCTSTLSQLLVRAYFDEGIWRDYIESLNEIYRARRDAMLDALAEFFPRQAEWTRPGGARPRAPATESGDEQSAQVVQMPKRRAGEGRARSS